MMKELTMPTTMLGGSFLMLPALSKQDVIDLERLRCLRMFWEDNPRPGDGLALVYWRALQEATFEGWFD